MNTAQRIIETVQALPESDALEVLDFAEYLRQKRAKEGGRGRPLLDVVDELPDLPSFKGDPVIIQRAMRDEWR